MGGKAKNAIMDILKSDDMRAYLEELLRGQTTEILSKIHELEENESGEEIQELKKLLHEEQEKNRGLALKIQELEISNNHFSELYEDKKSESERVLQLKQESDNEVALLKKQNKQLETMISEEKLKSDVELQKEKTEKAAVISKLEEYENKYACIDRAYSNYKSLPERVKQRMGNIFVRDNIYAFIVAMSDWNNIEGIWSFTKRRIIEDEKDGVKELVELFTEAFALFALIDGTGRYELINPLVGERFDSDKHSIKGIKTDGQIDEVLLSGIFDSTTKKVIFKAAVQIQ